MEMTLIGIFLEGLLSFLSPCVLPLLPLYMSYLAGDGKSIDKDGKVKYKTLKVFITTVFFVLGICLTLALLAASVNLIKTFLDSYRDIISIIGGTILIIFGFHNLGIIHIDILESDTRFKISLNLEKMNFIKAFLLGFVFSLGWSPCIGPMLANALMMVATQDAGYMYIVCYGLGLVIPFLITGLLTSTILNFINSKKNILKWVLKIAGIILICFGCYMIKNASDNIVNSKETTEDTGTYLIQKQFVDQNGKDIKLADYKGKYIVLDFTTTWCNYCKDEIPEYLEFANEHPDVVCLYVMDKNSSNCTDETLLNYINENIRLKVLIDEGNELASYCGVSVYPTKFIIDPDGKFICYTSGAMDCHGFEDFLNYAIQLYENADN